MSEEMPQDDVEYAPSDVIAVLDHLIEMISSARVLPLSASIVVNQAELLELLHSAKDALPADLVAADGIVADATAVLDRADLEAEQILSDANAEATKLREYTQQETTAQRQEAEQYSQATHEKADVAAKSKVEAASRQAEKIIADAQAEAERLVASEKIVHEAQERAAQTVQAADARARQLAAGADNYCDEKLNELENLLAQISKQARGGRAALAKRSGFEPQG